MGGTKNILLGVSGSIAAYKAVFLTRLLVKENYNVKVIMTKGATDFVAPLSFSTLSNNAVYTRFTDDVDSGVWNNHVELALWADLLLIAPATANTIAKMANGMCDSILLATYLSAKCPVMFAPAMDRDMYLHASVSENINKLVQHANILIEPGIGELASGLHGQGRMAEPEEILEKVKNFFAESQPLKNKKALVTAGPTYEAIDPVRFIGNRSSGKMGIAIANELAKQGAEVTLVLGPVSETESIANIHILKVESAEEMYNACVAVFPQMDIAVFAAAVADYSPSEKSQQKIKKSSNELEIKLEKTKDILGSLGLQKTDNQIIVGFALETENEIIHAQEKLHKKKADLIVLNSLNDKGAGFGTDTNKVSFIKANAPIQSFELKSKTAVAKDIVHEIITLSI